MPNGDDKMTDSPPEGKDTHKQTHRHNDIPDQSTQRHKRKSRVQETASTLVMSIPYHIGRYKTRANVEGGSGR